MTNEEQDRDRLEAENRALRADLAALREELAALRALDLARQRAVAEQREREERLRTLIDATPDIVCLKDGQGRWLEANRADLELFQLEGVDYRGKKDSDLAAYSSFYREALLRCEETDEASWAYGKASHAVEVIPRPDGSTKYLDVIKVPVFDADGRRKGLAVLGRDITDRHAAEVALAEEKERLAVTLRSIGDGVITTDADGTVALMNPVAERLTDWQEKDAFGRRLEEVFRTRDEETGEPCAELLRSLLDARTRRGPANRILVARNGDEMFISDSGAPIRDAAGEVRGVVVVFRDTTAQRAAQEELLNARKLESLALLAGGVAHDFNNILIAVLGNVSLMRQRLDTGDELYGMLTQVEHAAERARELTRQLLTFAKDGTPIRRTASIAALIEDSVTFTLRGSKVCGEFHIAPDLAATEIDEGQVSQVLNNLAVNAIQAMPQGGRLEVSARNARITPGDGLSLSPGDYVCIDIRDEGVGIPEENLSRIFDPYFTTKPTGTGLGLATAYSIAKHHDGLLAARSTPGVGSTFSLYLPASEAPLPPPRREKLAPLLSCGRVLVMDDDETVREVATSMLRRLGCEVVAVPEGAAAIEAYGKALERGRRFDAVILDLTIPGGMGGRQAVELLRDLDPDVRAIVSSGYSNDPIMTDFRQFGFSGAVRKPYSVAELAEGLSSALQRR